MPLWHADDLSFAATHRAYRHIGTTGIKVKTSTPANADLNSTQTRSGRYITMSELPPVSKRGSKSIGENRRRDADAAARAQKGLPPIAEAPNDEGRSSGHGPHDPIPKS